MASVKNSMIILLSLLFVSRPSLAIRDAHEDLLEQQQIHKKHESETSDVSGAGAHLTKGAQDATAKHIKDEEKTEIAEQEASALSISETSQEIKHSADKAENAKDEEKKEMHEQVKSMLLNVETSQQGDAKGEATQDTGAEHAKDEEQKEINKHDESALLDVEASQEEDAKDEAHTVMANNTGAKAYLIWFKGLRKCNAPACCPDPSAWVRGLIDKDAFTFAGHFAVGQSKCAPFGYGPVIPSSTTNSEALTQAKNHHQWPGQWSNDFHHMKTACDAGAKVLYREVTCVSGSGIPGASRTDDYQYSFPCWGNRMWKQSGRGGVWNCATFPSTMPAFPRHCKVPAVLRCQESGLMEECPKEGEDPDARDWCAECASGGNWFFR